MAEMFPKSWHCWQNLWMCILMYYAIISQKDEESPANILLPC